MGGRLPRGEWLLHFLQHWDWDWDGAGTGAGQTSDLHTFKPCPSIFVHSVWGEATCCLGEEQGTKNAAGNRQPPPQHPRTLSSGQLAYLTQKQENSQLTTTFLEACYYVSMPSDILFLLQVASQQHMILCLEKSCE